MAASVVCDCGAKGETVGHDVFQCPIHLPLCIARPDLDETIDWLLNTCPAVECRQTVG